MSDLRELDAQTNELRDISNKSLSAGYKTREISIGEVSSCNKSENEYLVYLIDEDVTVKAILTGLLNNTLLFSKPDPGDLVLILHKGTSDAMIFSLLDKQRSESYKENKESNPFNNSQLQSAQAPT